MMENKSRTLIIVTPYRSISLAAAFFTEILKTRMAGVDGFRVLTRDYGRCLHEVDISFVRDMLLYKPPLIGFSCFFWNMEQNLKLAALAKTLMQPGPICVFGGPQVGGISHAAKLIEEQPAVDAVICGEADLRFPELVHRFFSDKGIENIGCLAVRKSSGVHLESGLCHIEDLSRLPIVYHGENEYLARSLHPKIITPLQTLRGCRNKCAYCLYCTSSLRFFPLDRVEKEVAFICQKRIEQVRIVDSHFAGTKKRAMALFDIIKGLNIDTAFYIYPDPEHVDPDYIQAGKSANCRIISAGVETMDPKVSALVSRSSDLKGYRRLLSAFSEGKNRPQIEMMMGLPRQSADSLRQDLTQLKIDRAHRVMISPLMVFPGTELASEPLVGEVSIIETPQQFAFSSAFGQDDYADQMALAECFSLFSSLRWADSYLRSQLADDAQYENRLQRWFIGAGRDRLREILALKEIFQSAASYIRASLGSLIPRAAVLLKELWDQQLDNLDLLYECLDMDLNELAMIKRHEELLQHPRPQAPTVTVLFGEHLLRKRWVLHEEAWLMAHNPPTIVLSEELRGRSGQEAARVHCLYFCPGCVVNFLDRAEFAFLKRFEKPTIVFDTDNPYSTATLNLARNWLGRGVLTDGEEALRAG